MNIKIANNLILPLEIVTETIAILAKRRAGKSYTARKFAEQLFKANQQIVIVDPKGDYWGIRSSKDGKGPGLQIIILGGQHGDISLEVGSGEMVARLVVEERVSILLDLSDFRKNEVATFMTAFLENLYRLKNHEKYRTPMMLIVDEADAIMPQKPYENEARMLGAGEDIVRRGGQRGIGMIMITQRSAVLNKNVLTQSQVLIALRTIAPQDLAAMDAWIDVHGTEEERATLMESLPALPIGDAWIWSPGWPTANGIFEHVHILPLETFDSGATPKPGEKRIQPKNLADIDLSKLAKQMQSTIEKAKDNDPILLKKKIKELESELKKKQPQSKVVQPQIDKKILREIENKLYKRYSDDIDNRDKQIKKFQKVIKEIVNTAIKFKDILDDNEMDLDFTFEKELDKEKIDTESWGKVIGQKFYRGKDLKPIDINSDLGRALSADKRPIPPGPSLRKESLAADEGDIKLGLCERAIIQFLASYPERAWTLIQISVMINYSTKSSGFVNAVSRLNTLGFIVKNGKSLQFNSATGSKIGQIEQREYSPITFLNNLGKCEREIYEVLLNNQEKSFDKETLAEATQSKYSTQSSGFVNAISKLRTLGLLEKNGNQITLHTEIKELL